MRCHEREHEHQAQTILVLLAAGRGSSGVISESDNLSKGLLTSGDTNQKRLQKLRATLVCLGGNSERVCSAPRNDGNRARKTDQSTWQELWMTGTTETEANVVRPLNTGQSNPPHQELHMCFSSCSLPFSLAARTHCHGPGQTHQTSRWILANLARYSPNSRWPAVRTSATARPPPLRTSTALRLRCPL